MMTSNGSHEMSIQVRTGRRIAELRKKYEMTQDELAYFAEISTTYLGQIERGMRSPTVETIEKICSALHISLAEFFTFPDLSNNEKKSLVFQSIHDSLVKVPEDVSVKLSEIISELVDLYNK
ncbi:MAG: helix-turn-helix transcriptional regulator [Firmicutes bacterium]|nr:helix-turn-helix transcriptional regulator [Bacillota bacterium]MBQ9972495.1 helix-turn-helix transcriptional regulator [Bacillota bacterium]